VATYTNSIFGTRLVYDDLPALRYRHVLIINFVIDPVLRDLIHDYLVITGIIQMSIQRLRFRQRYITTTGEHQ